MSPKVGTADQILDGGVAGLLYFEHYLPILHRVIRQSTWTYPDICARYDEQRGLDLGRLAGDADIVRSIAAVARSEVGVQETSIVELRDAWFGAAADAALAELSSDVGLARGRAVGLEDLGQAMAAAVDGIGNSIAGKAHDVGKYDPRSARPGEWSSIEGKTLSDVEIIDRVAELDPSAPGFLDPVLLWGLETALPEAMSEPLSGRGTAASIDREKIAHAQAVSARWLREVFAPIVSQACRHVADICRATDDAVRGQLTTIAAVAESVGAVTFAPSESGTSVPQPISVATASAGAPGPLSGSPSSPGMSTGGGLSGLRDDGGSTRAIGSSMPTVPGDPGLSVTPGLADGRMSQPPGAGPFGGVTEALEAIYGRLPTCEDLVEAIEQAGRSICEQLKSALADAVTELGQPDLGTESGLDAPPPSSGLSPAPDWSSPGPAALGPAAPDPAVPDPPSPGSPSTPVPSSPSHQLSPLQPPPDGTAERGHLDAALDGHSARLAVTHGGVVSLELGTPDGSAQRFELRPGPFGLPTVVQTEGVTGGGPAVITADSPVSTEVGGPPRAPEIPLPDAPQRGDAPALEDAPALGQGPPELPAPSSDRGELSESPAEAAAVPEAITESPGAQVTGSEFIEAGPL